MDDRPRTTAYPGLSERIKERREFLKLLQKDVGEACGVSRVAATQWERGTSDPEPKRQDRLIGVLKTNRGWLFHGVGSPSQANRPQESAPPRLGTITVKGDLAAGAWLEAVEWAVEDQFDVEMPVQSRWRDVAYGLRIKGRSMNKKWPDSTIVVCVPFLEYGFDLISGMDYVVAHQQNALGHTEATAKRYEIHGDEIWLCPESDDDTFVEIKIQRNSDESLSQAGKDETYISAVILGGYSPTPAGLR